jgi:hypothetical protein
MSARRVSSFAITSAKENSVSIVWGMIISSYESYSVKTCCPRMMMLINVG